MALTKQDWEKIAALVQRKLDVALGRPGAPAPNGQIWDAIRELTGAVKGLEAAVERLDVAVERLDAAVEELAAAQKRTEERLEELAAAQKRTEERLEQLARTQQEGFAELRQVVAQLASQVGGLSRAVGFSLEEIGRELLPAYLARRFGVDVAALPARWFPLAGRQIEINYVGQGRRNGREIVVLGESQSRIGPDTVADFAGRFDAVEPTLPAPAFRFAFGFSVHPDAEEPARQNRIELIAGWQLKQP